MEAVTGKNKKYLIMSPNRQVKKPPLLASSLNDHLPAYFRMYSNPPTTSKDTITSTTTKGHITDQHVIG